MRYSIVPQDPYSRLIQHEKKAISLIIVDLYSHKTKHFTIKIV